MFKIDKNDVNRVTPLFQERGSLPVPFSEMQSLIETYSSQIVSVEENNRSSSVHFNRGNCVYLLLDGGEVVYVGQTINLCARIGTHISDGKSFDEVASMRVDRKDMLLIEGFNIHHYEPKLNIVSPSRAQLISWVAERLA